LAANYSGFCLLNVPAGHHVQTSVPGMKLSFQDGNYLTKNNCETVK